MFHKTLTQETLREIIRRVVEVADPDRIILFGSAARDEMASNSDVDLLVIKSGEFEYGELMGDIYMNLHGVGLAVDVILATPEQVGSIATPIVLSLHLHCERGGKCTMRRRYPPDDPREGLNRNT